MIGIAIPQKMNPGLSRSQFEALNLGDLFLFEKDTEMSENNTETPGITAEDAGFREFTDEGCLEHVRRIAIRVVKGQPGHNLKKRFLEAARVLGSSASRIEDLWGGEARATKPAEYLNFTARYVRWLELTAMPAAQQHTSWLADELKRWGSYRVAFPKVAAPNREAGGR